MKHILPSVLVFFFLISSLSPNAQTVNYNDVAVIVNDQSTTSLNIGNYFAAERNIPAQNIIHISTPVQEEINDAEFEIIRNQIESYLVNNNLTDSFNYLVTTKGVPLKVYRGASAQFDSSASFDSEIALILGPLQDSIGLDWPAVPNPYYGDSMHFSRANFGIYLVTRLEGYTETDVLNLIDRSGPNRQVEVNTSISLFDINGSNQATIDYFNLLIDQGTDVLSVYDIPHLTQIGSYIYLSGYSNVFIYGIMQQLFRDVPFEFSWVEGSIASLLYLSSTSTFTDSLNINNHILAADAIAEGATGATGHCYNYSYVSFFPNLEKLFSAYLDQANHFNLAESFYLSYPQLSYTQIIIGDPKTSINLYTGIDEVATGAISVYPNPTTSQLHFTLPTQETIQQIIITTTDGRVVRVMDSSSFPLNNEINVSRLSAGFYLVNIKAKDAVFVSRFIKL